MKLFDKKYLICVPDDDAKALIGKEVFFANSINKIIKNVSEPSLRSKLLKVWTEVEEKEVYDSYQAASPFAILDKGYWQFIYYDPYYDFKIAYNEGKTIQYQIVGGIDWKDIETENELLNRIDENGGTLRIKPEKSKYMSYRQLAEWLAKGNGQYTPLLNKCFISSSMDYDCKLDNDKLIEGYKIRYWGSDKWIEPTTDVYLKDCKQGDINAD